MDILWFLHNHIGRKVKASHPDHGTGSVHIKDRKHALAIYRHTEATSGYHFEDDPHEGRGLNVLEILAYEALVNNTPTDDPAPAYDETMTGGQFAGAGASGSWNDDNPGGNDNDPGTSFDGTGAGSWNDDNSSNSDSSSNSDYSSSDSGSSSDSSSSDY